MLKRKSTLGRVHTNLINKHFHLNINLRFDFFHNALNLIKFLKFVLKNVYFHLQNYLNKPTVKKYKTTKLIEDQFCFYITLIFNKICINK